jgi:hypothetical protein
LLTDIRRKREQLLALEGKRCRSLLLGAADVDTLPQVDRPCTRCQSVSPSSTQSIAGLALSSSCIVRVSGAMTS